MDPGIAVGPLVDPGFVVSPGLILVPRLVDGRLIDLGLVMDPGSVVDPGLAVVPVLDDAGVGVIPGLLVRGIAAPAVDPRLEISMMCVDQRSARARSCI